MPVTDVCNCFCRFFKGLVAHSTKLHAVLDMFVLRRRKDETEVKLPLRRVTTTFVEFDGDHMSFYRALEAGAQLKFKEYLKARLDLGLRLYAHCSRFKMYNTW